MANKDTPEAVRYMGQLYVYAGDEEPLDDAMDGMADEMADEEAPEDEAPADMEEVELVDALKGFWQTVLDRLPDDLDVDEEFEEALNGMEEVIQVLEEMHTDYSDEEAPPEEGDAPLDELPEEMPEEV